MPDPVGSVTNGQRSRDENEIDLEYGAEASACVSESRIDAPPQRKPAPRSTDPALSAAAQKLVERATKRRPLGVPAATDTSAQRRAATPVEPLHARAGVTSSGTAVYAEAALLKGRKGGAQVEVMGISAQQGLENEQAVTLGAVSVQSKNGHHALALEVGTAKVNEGVQNPDGSKGVNVGFGVNLGALEYTYSKGDYQLSVGLSLGVGKGAELAAGVRDVDHDGRQEECVRMGFGPLTIGTCSEPDPIPPPEGAEGAASSPTPREIEGRSDGGQGGSSGRGEP